MTQKIEGSQAFVSKVKQAFKQEANASINIYWKEATSEWIEISCSIQEVDVLVKVLSQLQITGQQLVGKTSRGQIVFLASEIYWIEAFGNDVETTLNKQRVSLDKKLYEYETQLEDDGYIRVGKSMLINTNKIISVASAYNGKLLLYLDNGEKVYVNRSYTKHFKEVLIKKRG